MLKNYLKVALRNLRKHKGYTVINVLGLSIGMTCCVLISLYVADELSFDRFHANADQIYRLRVERYSSGGESELTSTASAPMAPAILQDHPQVEQAVRISQRTYLVEQADRRFYEEDFFWVDSSFFDVFSFDLVQGDPETALTAPFSVVLTESMVTKYFGQEDPMGQILTIEERDLRVTGVVEDAPEQSHFDFDFLGSFTTLEAFRESSSSEWNWWNLSFHTYLLLAEGTSVEALQEQLRELPSRYIGNQESGSGYRQFLYLQPLSEIHLYSHYRYELKPNSYAAYVYVFSAIALFILVLACINFMNLATARSAQRAQEVGMRKVLGARKGQMVKQFLGESVFLSLLALMLALVLIQVALPMFNQLAAKDLSFHYVRQASLVLGLVGFAVMVGLVAGSYPALVLSSFRPIDVFKGQFRSGASGALLRQGLVVFQFAVSVGLIVGALIVFQQLNFMQNKNLGFEKEQVLVLNVRNNETVIEGYRAFKAELKNLPAVVQTTFSSSIPGRNQFMSVISRNQGMNEEGQTMNILAVDYDFAETYGLEMATGRTFSEEFPSDTSAFLINEAALKALGWQKPDEALNQELTRQFSDTREIVGVVKDFHFQSLQHAIDPIVFQIRQSWFNYVSVRISTEDVPQTVAAIQGVWETFSPGRPLEYFFLDDDYDRQYRSEQRISKIVTTFTILALFIACLGLFGLAAFTAEQRTKEIGVRKVLGASVGGIVVLLSKDFVKLVALAFVLAAPVAYFVMGRWLEDFAYRIEISWPIFLMAGLAAFVVALVTVSYQSIRAAMTDPVESLRYE